MLLLKRAVDAWNTVDRKARPAQERIVARDGYLCQVPGCTSRRNLEVHHIRFRSRGGDDDPANLITLCHAHHRHMLHKGAIRLTGRAPHALRWEIGCVADGRVIWRLRGERFEEA
jgi:5-methylcytosine-specific restriction endonuclease McrA